MLPLFVRGCLPAKPVPSRLQGMHLLSGSFGRCSIVGSVQTTSSPYQNHRRVFSLRSSADTLDFASSSKKCLSCFRGATGVLRYWKGTKAGGRCHLIRAFLIMLGTHEAATHPVGQQKAQLGQLVMNSQASDSSPPSGCAWKVTLSNPCVRLV